MYHLTYSWKHIQILTAVLLQSDSVSGVKDSLQGLLGDVKSALQSIDVRGALNPVLSEHNINDESLSTAVDSFEGLDANDQVDL